MKLLKNDAGDKMWQGVLLSVQPRIRLTRSFDQRSHTYLGYALKVRGRVGTEAREFLVGVGQGAHTKHHFRAGNALSGDALPVPVPRLEPVEFYKVSNLRVGLLEAKDEGPPLRGTVFRRRLRSTARAAIGDLPRAPSRKVLELHLGMPDAGRDDHRPVESEPAPLSNRDLLLRSALLSVLPIWTDTQDSRP